MSPRSIISAINAFLAILWPASVYAAGSTFGQTFRGVGAEAWMMVVILSTLAGLTALLNRITAELQKADAGGAKIPSLRLFIASNMLGSWMTGVFFFLLFEHLSVSDFLEAAGVIGSSYCGARLVERMMESTVDKILDRVFGARVPVQSGTFIPKPKDGSETN